MGGGGREGVIYSNWFLSPALRVYSGHRSYLLNIYDLEVNPSLWLSVVSSHKIRDTYCSYAAIEVCCKELGSATDQLKVSTV